MKFRILLVCMLLPLTGRLVSAQITGDAIGIHDFGPGSRSPITGARPDFCMYCHQPHSALNRGLWNQTLTTQSYTTYTSDTEKNRGMQPLIGGDSNMCLSCHDGTVAVGSSVVYGQVTTQGSMSSMDVFGANLQPSHPFSLALPIQDNVDLVASLASQGRTADPTGAVKLVNGNIECTSCHDPHVQARDLISQNFLVRDSSSGQMCLACHDPNRQLGGTVNPLADWATSAHAISQDKLSAQALVGSYPTVATNACISCHAPHKAPGAQRLLRGPNEQDCIACHNGGANLTPPAPNVFSEYTLPKVGHPFPTSVSPHDANENTLLNNNRHATCVDCHNGHSSAAVTTFPPPPTTRASQKDIAGISANDGTTVVNPSLNQYENCLRCHGTSAGKQSKAMYGYSPLRIASSADRLNLVPQLAMTATSSHPVTHDSNSALMQNSLLPNMLNLDGVTPSRSMGTRILCTDCHNSDDNREFGGTGPNGPHGSKWPHILERRYEFSQATGPGQMITNIFPNPDLTVNGPYAICGKCHDLSNQIIKNTSWTEHSRHINDGFSCSVCHTAHGVGSMSATISGQRLIDFDENVVAQNGAIPISYNRASNTCALVCHGVAHNPTGTIAGPHVRTVPGGLPLQR